MRYLDVTCWVFARFTLLKVSGLTTRYRHVMRNVEVGTWNAAAMRLSLAEGPRATGIIKTPLIVGARPASDGAYRARIDMGMTMFTDRPTGRQS